MLTEWLTLGSVLTVDGLRHRSDRRRIVPSRDGGWLDSRPVSDVSGRSH